MGSSYWFKSTAIKWTYLQTCNGTYKPCWNWSVPAAIVPTTTSLRDEWELPPLHPSPFSTGELLIASYIQRVSYSQDSKNKGKQNTSDSGEQKPGEKSLNFIWRKGSVTFGAASWQQVNILVHCFSMVWEDAKGEIIHGTSNRIKFL